MNAIFEKLAIEYARNVAIAVATELAKHELKKNMSCDALLELLDISATPNVDGEESEIEIDKDELPQGLSVARAKVILGICKKGVPEGEYVHVVSQKIMAPTKQQATFYKNEKARIFGPPKTKEAIDFLAKKAGKVTDPEEPTVDAAIPSTWTLKNVKKLRERVVKCPEDQMVNAFTSRRTKFNPSTMVKHDEYYICASKTDKLKFLALVAFLEEQDDWDEIEREPEETVAKPKKGKVEEKPKGRKAKKEESEEEVVVEKPKGRKAKKEVVVEEEVVVEKPKGRKAKEVVVEKPKGRKAKKEAEESEEEVKPKGRKAAAQDETENDETEEMEEENDGTASDDEQSGEKDSSEEEQDVFDEILEEGGVIDYNGLDTALHNRKEDEYINVYTHNPSRKTDAMEKTHTFDDDFHIYVKKENTERATKALLGTIRKNLAGVE